MSVLFIFGGYHIPESLLIEFLKFPEMVKTIDVKELPDLEYIEPVVINRSSRRGNKESKRKKNFNHYS
jgi:hypothetical protein